MAIHIGIAFDVLPLIHGIVSFDHSMLRLYMKANIAGQLFILIGLLSDDVELMQELSTVGISLLCWSLIILGMPAKILNDNKKTTADDPVGIASVLPGLILPFIAVTILMTWLLRDIPGWVDVGFAVILVFLLNMINFASFLSHFNRRINLNILTPKNISFVFITLLILSLLHIIVAYYYGRGEVSRTMFSLSLGLPFLWIFLSTKPHKLLMNSFSKGKLPYSKLLLASLFSHLFLAAITLLEPLGVEIGIGVTYCVFLFTTSLLCAWGMALYLHQDHMHVSTHNRKTPWITLLSSMIGGFLIIYVFIELDIFDGGFAELELLWNASLLISCISWSFLMLKDLLLPEKNWHKVPMFYDRYIK